MGPYSEFNLATFLIFMVAVIPYWKFFDLNNIVIFFFEAPKNREP